MIPRAWVFFGATFLYLSMSTVALYRYSPELLVQRLRMRRGGSKTWDEVLMRACNLTVMLIVPVVAGLDVGRYQWSRLGVLHAGVGLLLFIVSSVLINWAMIENPHFEPTVRIQEDRGHRVVTTGPYGIVRHPGYPVALYAILMALRTHLEDRTLHVELTGYPEYARRVRYRLFPGIW